MEIIDSHTHWGPSLTMHFNVTTNELLRQARESRVDKIIVFPFPSTAIDDESFNDVLLHEAERIDSFIPYFYIPESGMQSIPAEKGFYGGKWHWMRGIQDSRSNYDVLNDHRIDRFIEESEAVDLPVILEEELEFTELFVNRTRSLKIIIPHMGLLGGNPADFLHVFKDRENVYFDTALAGSGTIKRFIDEVGPERVIFGSDVPFGTMRGELATVLGLSLNEKDMELILSGNIRRLIRLPA